MRRRGGVSAFGQRALEHEHESGMGVPGVNPLTGLVRHFGEHQPPTLRQRTTSPANTRCCGGFCIVG